LGVRISLKLEKTLRINCERDIKGSEREVGEGKRNLGGGRVQKEKELEEIRGPTAGKGLSREKERIGKSERTLNVSERSIPGASRKLGIPFI